MRAQMIPIGFVPDDAVIMPKHCNNEHTYFACPNGTTLLYYRIDDLWHCISAPGGTEVVMPSGERIVLPQPDNN